MLTWSSVSNGLAMAHVVHEVRHAVDEPRDQAVARTSGRVSHDRGRDRDHREREVQHADVAHEVLVEGPVGRDPGAPDAGEVVVEAAGEERPPRPR